MNKLDVSHIKPYQNVEKRFDIADDIENICVIKQKSPIPRDFHEILAENIGSSPEKLNPQCPSSFNFSVRARNIKSADTVVDRPHQASRVSQSEVAGKELPPKVKKRRGRKEGKELDLMSTKPITHFFRKEAPDLHNRLKGESNTGKENLDNLNHLNL